MPYLNKISVFEFIEGLNKVEISNVRWLQKRKPIEMYEDSSLSSIVSFLSFKKKYLVIKDCEIIGVDKPVLNEIKTDNVDGLIFVNFRTPGLHFINCEIDLFFFNSYSTASIEFQESRFKKIQISNESNFSDIKFSQKCSCSYLYIFTKSVINDLNIENCSFDKCLLDNESIMNNLLIGNNSSINGLTITTSSKVADITIKESSNLHKLSIISQSSSLDIKIIDNSTCGSIDIIENSSCSDLQIIKSVCSELFFDESKINDLSIESSTRVNKITAYNCKLGDVIIEQWSIVEKIRLSDESSVGHIYIQDKSIVNDLNISEYTKSGDIHLSENSVCTNLFIQNFSKVGPLSIVESLCSNIDIINSEVDSIDFIDSIICMKLQNAKSVYINVFSCYILDMEWLAGTKCDLYIDKCSINRVSLIGTTLSKESSISINDTNIKIIVIDKFLVIGSLLLRNISSTSLSVESYENRLEFFFDTLFDSENVNQELLVSVISKCKQIFSSSIHNSVLLYGNDQLFRISNSSLGKLEIIGSRLEYFVFEYSNSKIIDSFITGTILPKNNIKVYNQKADFPDKARYIFEQKVSVYNQLKKVFENQGDIVEATWYHSKAMENQEKLLQLDYKSNQKKLFNEAWFNLKSFQLNRLSNNHGESWRLALRFIVLIAIVAYVLYYTAIHYKEPFSFNEIDRFIGGFFPFLDPTHKIDFLVDKSELWSIPIIIDFISRAFIGYGIYQFIAAFRRHGRKAG